MKRKLIAAVLLLSLLLTACGAKAAKRDALPFTADSQLYAVAYLGYGEMRELDYFKQNYIDAKEVPLYYFSGAEYYLLIPRYADAEIKLYRNDLATMSRELVYEPAAREALILQCNISDIFPDATVSLTYQGETVEFSPYISLKDGSVQVGERGLNISR